MMDIGWAEFARYLVGAALYLVLEASALDPAAAQHRVKLAKTEPRSCGGVD